ncbi:MAG: ribose 5-phosphate isomerase, partial [Nitrospirae bacterium]|nr:ribose 5-phosphate isomerase [Nitrospirota bacterium]
MIIAIGADHGGFHLKQTVLTLLKDLRHTVLDIGAYTNEPTDDYPDFAMAVA